MNSKIKGTVDAVYIRSGEKNGKGWVMLSNGRKEFFVSILVEDLEMFANASEDDIIEMEVEMTIGSDRVKILSVA
jgi:hypothetical protein